MLEDHLDKLLLYESGELSPQETAEFVSHLASCAECKSQLGAARMAHEWAKGVPEDAPPEVLAAVLAAHGPAPAAAAGRGWFRGAALATAAACFAVALIVLRRPETPSSDADLSVRVWELEQRRVEFQKELQAFKAQAGTRKAAGESR